MKRRLGLLLGVFMVTTIFGVLLSAFPISGQQNGGIVTFAWLEDTRVMNPWTISTTWEAYIAQLVYDFLWETNPETLVVEPWLCHTWEKADVDGKEWLISIYDNATFHDGHPLTVEDIVFNWMFAKYAGTYRTALIETYLESVTIVNSTTVKFTLNQVYAPFPIGMDFFIVKTEDWDDFVINWSGDVSNMTEPWIINTAALLAEDMLGTDDPLQGTGGFKWIKRIPGQFIELDANPDYWHPRFQPRVDKLVMRIISNPAAQLLTLKRGDIDAMGWWVPPTQIASLENHPTVGIIQTPDLGYYHISFNMRSWPMNLTSYRRACRAMIDHHQIVDGFMLGYGIEGSTIVPPIMSYWHWNFNLEDYPWMDPEENITVSRLILANNNWYDTDGDGLYDTWDEGSGPLTLSGASNGTEWPNGITILAPSYDPVRVRACMMIANALEKVFDADFIPEIPDFNTLLIRAFYSNTFDMFILGCGLFTDPGPHLFGTFHSSSAGFPGSDNCFPIQNDTLDTAIDYFMNTTTGSIQNNKTRQQWGFEVQKMLIEQGPQYALYYRINVQAYRKDLIDGLVPAPGGYLGTPRSFYNVHRLAVVSAIPAGPAYTWYVVGGAVTIGVIGIALVARSNAQFAKSRTD